MGKLYIISNMGWEGRVGVTGFVEKMRILFLYWTGALRVRDSRQVLGCQMKISISAGLGSTWLNLCSVEAVNKGCWF